MQKKWVAGGVVAAAMVLGGAALLGVLAARKGDAAAPASAQTSAGDDSRPEVALQFTRSEVVRPALARMAAVVEFSGPLVAPQTATVRAKAGGTLLALPVSEGSRVSAGQTLGHIELAELGSRVAERSALLESARAAFVQAERTHAGNERLAAQQFISGNALDGSRAALDTARANLAAAQASLDATRLGLRDGRLVAPIAGIVARRHVLPGEKVSPEQQVLTIVDLARLELAGTVGTHEVSRLRPGLPVQVRFEGLGEPVSGRVARIAPAAEPGTRAIGVTIELANPGERLRAGQFALARAELADEVERLTLPVSAVGGASGQAHVWLIEDGRLARRAVTLGRRDERLGRVEVLQGLTPAATVLAARFDNLRDGASATVVAAGSAAMAGAAASSPLQR
ncbi:MAG: efflux RND transporter periplasmic adaptor subunit [Burkholderiaceae bacterium]|jgi:RND family efflux transporter MFP subunit|nr:efflux RND transporter periplasmic adaptor subunit [Burkholderiaceae bacterium]